MALWFVIVACRTEAPVPRSSPVPPTRDLSTPAVAFPADSPLAPFVPKGAPAWPTGPLGRLAPGLPLAEVRAIALDIRHPNRPPPDFFPAAGEVAVTGQLVGHEHIGFVAHTRDDRLISLDVGARPTDWEGVLETAWGPGTEGALANGLPTTVWTADGLKVTQVRGAGPLVVVKWEVQPSTVPSPADASH